GSCRRATLTCSRSVAAPQTRVSLRSARVPLGTTRSCSSLIFGEQISRSLLVEYNSQRDQGQHEGEERGPHGPRQRLLQRHDLISQLLDELKLRGDTLLQLLEAQGRII